MPKGVRPPLIKRERGNGMEEVHCITWDKPENAFSSYPKGIKHQSTAPINSEYERNRYDRLLEYLEEIIAPLSEMKFQEAIEKQQSQSPKEFDELLEWIFNDDDISALPREVGRVKASEVDFRAKRIKRCENCQRYFYDMSRNGRTKICHLKPAVKWVKSKKAFKAYFNKDGSLKSACQLANENAASRRSYNRKEKGRPNDDHYALTWGQLDKLYSFALLYPPVANTESEKRFLHTVEQFMGYSADPQDIVSGEEKPTHSFYNKPRRTPYKPNMVDWGGETFYRVNIAGGNPEGTAPFINGLLPIKKELPKIPKNKHENLN
jgi:hypothetical protein